MKVKIGESWFEPKVGQPIMLVLTDQDKWNISHMAESASKYAAFDENDPLDEQAKLEWMNR
jgi:hypothetical protein